MNDRTPTTLMIITIAAIIIGALSWATRSDATEPPIFPRYDVECADGTCIRVDTLTGDTWGLATPGAVSSWEWDALEVRDE